MYSFWLQIKRLFIWAAISALRSRFFVPMLFPVIQKELHSGRAARFADSKIKFKRMKHFGCKNERK